MPRMEPTQPNTPHDEDDIPYRVLDNIRDDPVEEPTSPQPSSRRLLLFAFLVYLVLILAVGLFAYFQGRQVLEDETVTQIQQSLQEQFELGVDDLEAGRYELARQRFEAIIRIDPNYPDAEVRVVQAYVALDVPTITPTPKPTGTPDPSPPEDLFARAERALEEQQWSTVIELLLAVRGKDPTFRPVDVDGLMYLALRNRGMILITQGLMEEGLYDLSLAERFGPLDRDAMFRKTLAQQYLLANSYFGLNWLKAAELFRTLCEQGATLDSCPKFAEAAWKYGDLEWDAGNSCIASEFYTSAYQSDPNTTLEPTAEYAEDVCATETAPPPPPPATETPTPTPDSGGGGNGS